MKTPHHLLTLLLGALAVGGNAHAHDEAKGAHGGQVRNAGIYHYELVLMKDGKADGKAAKDNPIVVYLTDQSGKKIPTAGAVGTATLLIGKDKATATLASDGGNGMQGRANYASQAAIKAVVSITMPGKPPEQARFALPPATAE